METFKSEIKRFKRECNEMQPINDKISYKAAKYWLLLHYIYAPEYEKTIKDLSRKKVILN